MRSGFEFSPFWGEPIQCPADFCTLNAMALAEAQADGVEDFQELETPHPPKDPGVAAGPPAPETQAQTRAFPVKLTKNQKKNAKD